MNCAIINRAAEQLGRNQLRKCVPEGQMEWIILVSTLSGVAGVWWPLLAQPMVAKWIDVRGVTSYPGFIAIAASDIPSTDRILAGIALMLGFCVTAPLLDVAAKLASGSVPVGQITAARFIVQCAPMAPAVWIMGLSLWATADRLRKLSSP